VLENGIRWLILPGVALEPASSLRPLLGAPSWSECFVGAVVQRFLRIRNGEKQYIKKKPPKNANPVKFLMRNRDQGGPTKQKKVKQTPGKKHRVTFDAKLQSERVKKSEKRRKDTQI
jgi:uncharacterized protein YneF (UPF0154 family)